MMAEQGPITPKTGSMAAGGVAPAKVFKFPTAFGGPGAANAPFDFREGQRTVLNITSATFIPGRHVLRRVAVVVSAAAASNIDDTVSGASTAAATQVLIIPASTTQGTVYTLHWPIVSGILITPGAGVTLAVSLD
jgi:hypothetical protein